MAKAPPTDRELIARGHWRELGERHALLAETVAHLENLPSTGTLALKDILAFDALERRVDRAITTRWEDVESSWLGER